LLVNFYTRPDMQACARVRRILDKLASEYELQVNETRVSGAYATTAAGAPVRAPALEVAGSRLDALDSTRGPLDEPTIHAYLELARAAGARRGSVARAQLAEAGQPEERGVSPVYRVKSYMWRHRVGCMIGALSAFLGVASLAPALPSLGMSGLYSAIFSAYRLVCVQTPERSPTIAGHQCCLCWRCISIYVGSLLFGIIYTLGRDGRLPGLGWLTSGIGLRGLVLFSLPMFADGLSHTFGLRPGVAYAHSPDFWLGWGELQFDWWLRVLTSLIATIGAVKFLCPRLDKLAQSYAARPLPEAAPTLLHNG
jgi:uncharacterized membrane protein